ncbi:hypothetical protein HIM_11601 [Hirsutella minnesotensis 3608]|uniref:Uncharacterized protein n=1 Tax=Hirsutella minnesotensis 3608 TaxID=1043627 RepID=A0A0F7ZWI1_9HYPO|nr:hypothetical protein HIM_11601 [Hirsutella minnesotensis 3608]
MSAGSDAMLELRDALLETKTCWCRNTSLFMEPEGAIDLTSSEADDTGERFWFVVVLPELSSYRVGRVMEDISLGLPVDAWYFGCREDHVSVSKYGHEMVHYCMTILLGCGWPHTVSEIRESAAKVLPERATENLQVIPCPIRPSRANGTMFESMATWVQSRIAFIQAAGKGDRREAARCAVFGFSGILWVLSKQFGRLSDGLATEMALAKYFSDEEDGLLDIESVPAGGKRGDFNQWTYLETPRGTLPEAIVIDESE